jgi:hypothetical protein
LISQCGSSRRNRLFNIGSGNAVANSISVREDEDEEEYIFPRPRAVQRVPTQSSASKSEASDDTADTSRTPVFQVRDPIASPRGTSTVLSQPSQNYHVDYDTTTLNTQRRTQTGYQLPSQSAQNNHQLPLFAATTNTIQSYHDLGDEEYDVADWD